MKELLEILKDMADFYMHPGEVVMVLLKYSPYIAIGVFLNWLLHRWENHEIHKELRRQGKGYLIDTGKNPKRPLHESPDRPASVRGDVKEGTDEGR